MSLIYFIYSLTMIAVLCGQKRTISLHSDDLDGDHRSQRCFLFFLWLVYSIILGSRVGFVDTSTYRMMAQRIGTDFHNLFDPSVAVVEPGFNFFMILINNISTDTQLFVFLTSTITLACVFIWIYKKSTDKMFSLFMFVALYMFTFMNGIRQSIVACIFVLFFDKWKNSKRWLVGLCLILFLIHNSVILLIPLYFCLSGKVFNWKMKGVFVFALLCVFSPGTVQRLFELVLTERYVETLSVSTGGSSVLRFLLNAVPVAAAIVYYLFMNASGNKVTKSEAMMINMLLLEFAIGICSLRATYFARMSIYFSLFDIVYFPYLLKKILARNSYLFGCVLSVMVYTVFFFYQAKTYNNYGYLREFYLFFLR